MRAFDPIHLSNSLLNPSLTNLTIRPARPYDNTDEIARLIYLTDPLIYPGWFRGCDESEPSATLTRLIMSPGSIFYWGHLTLATVRPTPDSNKEQIVALLNTLESPTSRHDYDYKRFKDQSPIFRDVIERYVEPLHLQARTSPDGTIIGVNLCTHPDYLHLGIARHLLRTFIELAYAQGYSTIEAECPCNNDTTLSLYHSFNFYVTSHLIGYAAPGETPPDIFNLRLDLNNRHLLML